ncbi:MAG: T9SS type A sorting domain-containing protein [Chitinophagaceae bacterium]
MKTNLPFTLNGLKVLFILLFVFLVRGEVKAQIPANDLCVGAVALSSSNTCSGTTGTLLKALVSTPAVATSCGTAGADVWYSFIAQSQFPTITLSSLGSNLSGAARIQLLSGNCGSLSSLACVTTNYMTVSTSYPTGLTIGVKYYIRVYSNTTSPTTGNWGFSICVTDPPPNDECANAVTLTSGSSCTNTAGTVGSANYASADGATACSGTDRYDVWYKFVAQRTNPTIALTSVGSNFLNARIQLLSGSCGSFTSVGCSSSASYTPTGLTVGATYYVRVYSTSTPLPSINADFNICITDPAPPANDLCANATTLSSAASCSNTSGTLLNATGTTGIPGDCGAVGSPEVWYRFTAASAYPTITLSSIGAQLTAAGPRIQLLSGSCGSFTSLGCLSATSMNAYPVTGGVGLTVGNTYYIRVYTNSAVMSGTTWGFNICITDPQQPNVDYGKGYMNITKGSNGGTIEPGDELEIRATIAVRSNMAFNPSFTGVIPGNTTYVPNTLRILTNEGKIYKQWTDAADGDPAYISGTNVKFNLGTGATQTMGGTIKNTDRPVANSTCIMIVSYHVIVGAVPFGTILNLGGGTISFYNASGIATNITFPVVNGVVYKNYGICANVVGSNGILSETFGTFGSGNTKDRAASGNLPPNYIYTVFSASAPGDYYYGISNNTSAGTSAANYSINPSDPVAAHHVFGVWDIIGDHTGASDPYAGNAPADVNNGQTGGYMAVINAAYRTDTAFLDTVRNLCPNTSYEYSAWFRNICPKCGADSTGAGPSSATYVPTGPGDSSGVHPNLTFNINGSDYYTTGDIMYTGKWIKKGFTYRTGPSETQMIISIRNNAPGGGGNDWAIDDIGVATCSPQLNLNPSTSTVNVCYADGFSLSAQVKSYFDNYTYYVWERSTDNGATFSATSYYSNGTIYPVYNGSEYEYTAVGPSFIGDSSTNNNLYRLRVASSASNLNSGNCSFVADRTVKVYVNNCMSLLKTDFVNVAGTLQSNMANIQWTTVNETPVVSYEVEKSTDGSHFVSVGKFKSNGQNGNGSYQFNDPAVLTGPGYYRIKLIEQTGFKYSKTILLSPSTFSFAIKNLVNPFGNTVQFDAIVPSTGDVKASIFDNYGRLVKIYTLQNAGKGLSSITIPNTSDLSSGIYTLKVSWQNETISKRLIKMNH